MNIVDICGVFYGKNVATRSAYQSVLEMSERDVQIIGTTVHPDILQIRNRRGSITCAIIKDKQEAFDTESNPKRIVCTHTHRKTRGFNIPNETWYNQQKTGTNGKR
eukprot:13817_1